MKIPLYKLLINPDEEGEQEETGVDMISLVDNPAVGYSYELFSNKMKFNIENEEKKIVSGVIMLANTPIYRANPVIGEHYVVFEKDTIRHIMQKFFKNKYHLQANFNHAESQKLNDVYFYESFQVDEERGIKSPAGYDLPDGSWFGTLKVDNDEIWEEIKNGTFTGFSVEGMFNYKLDKEEADIEQLIKEAEKLLESM